MSSPIYLHQIFYNETSRQQIDPLCIPWDNCNTPHADWFEFGVIKNYLDTHTLDENAYYGFISPKFCHKTGISIQNLLSQIQQLNHADVILVTGNNEWMQQAIFRNPFEQGEFWHRGLLNVSMQAAQRLNWQINPAEMVCSTYNFTFCNYIIAKPNYWRIWQQYAHDLFNYCEQSHEPLAQALNAATTHANNGIHYAVKVFIQERLPAIILQKHPFTLATIENLAEFPILYGVADSPYNRALLMTCNMLKHAYLQDGNPQHLNSFEHIRHALLGMRPNRV